MKARELTLNDHTVHLRLSSWTLSQYAADTGSTGNTLFSVLDALDDLNKQGALFTAALTYQGNPNEIFSGFDLIDMLADADYGPIRIKELIVTLAVDAGVVSNVDAVKLVTAIKAGNERLYNTAVAVLSGDTSGLPAPVKQETENPEGENPI